MSDDIREPHLRHRDFLGAFGLIEVEQRVLMVRNERVIGGRRTATWDLPGGQVEPGETLVEALRRELREELAIEVHGDPEFEFVQEGDRTTGDVRSYVWRSFFFRVEDYEGEPRPTGEVSGMRWVAPEEMAGLLTAPYHDSYLAWLRSGGAYHRGGWRD